MIGFDRRGFGATRATTAPGWDPLADVDAVLAATGVERPVVLGNSMGGSVAIDWVLANPGRAAALVLLGPAISGFPGFPGEYLPVEEALDAAAYEAAAEGRMEEANRLEIHYWLDGPAQPEGRVSGAARALLREMNHRALTAEDPGEPVRHPAAWERLGEIDVPTLVVAGEWDETGLVWCARRIAEAVTDGRFVELPGSAHLPSLDAPERLSEVVLAFLAGQAR